MISGDLFNPVVLTQAEHEAERLAATRAALQRERAGYEAAGNEAGVAAVDRELKRLAAGPKRAGRQTETVTHTAPEQPGGGKQ